MISFPAAAIEQEGSQADAESVQKLAEFRCVKCNKLLFKAVLTGGSHVEIVCTRCKEMNLEDAS